MYDSCHIHYPRHTESPFPLRYTGSNELDTEDTYAVVTRNEHIKVEKSFVVHLHFHRLGWWRAGVMRMVGRGLWVGPIP